MSRRILITETNVANRIMLRGALQNAHYSIIFSRTPEDVFRAVSEHKTDIILCQEGFSAMSLEDFCNQVASITADMARPSIPVILLEPLGSPEKRLEALWAGASDSITFHPFYGGYLMAYLRNCFRQLESEQEIRCQEFYNIKLGLVPVSKELSMPKKIGIFIKDTPKSNAMIRNLTRLTSHQVSRRDYSEVLAPPSDATPPADDVYVLFPNQQDMNVGLTLLSELRSHNKTRFSRLIISLPFENPQAAAMAFDMSANDVLFLPCTDEEMALRAVFQLERKHEGDLFRQQRDEGLNLAMRDPLTHLYNLRYVEHYMAHLQKQSTEQRHTFCILLIDVDRFKQINDKYGHMAGDDVLKALAFRLNDKLRTPDVLARIGGEEFLVILNTDSQEIAMSAADRIRQSIASQPFVLRSGEKINVMVSIGVALHSTQDEKTVENTLNEADGALYAAKDAGRNQTRFATRNEEFEDEIEARIPNEGMKRRDQKQSLTKF